MLTLRFRVAYLTVWGQHVVLRAQSTNGDSTSVRESPMACRWEGKRLIWHVTLALAATDALDYKYVVVDEAGLEVKQETVVRSLALGEGLRLGDVVEVCDTWQDASSPYAVVAQGAFRKALGFPTGHERHRLRPVPRRTPQAAHVVLRFVVRDWLFRDPTHVQLYVTGGLPDLGNWQPEKLFKLTQSADFVWEGEVLVPCHSFSTFTYKYAINDGEKLFLETGESRLVSITTEPDGAPVPVLMVLEDGHFRHEKYWKGAGVAIPVFSLRTEQSLGVGEFLDLKLLVDLCVQLGLEVVQILPVNDTRVHGMWWDSYPYSSLSVFALHPLYLSVEALAEELPSDVMQRLEEAREQLEALDEVDYEKTLETKIQLAREIYAVHGQATLESEAFLQFFESSADWLMPYAAFLFLHSAFGTPEHWTWGALAHPSEQDIERIVAPSQPWYAQSVGFNYWLQFHLHQQLNDAKCYAERHEVALKGDLPIGVDKCSVDTWMHPSLFRMDKSTGAPPDAFDPNGQNWGFPTYNWEEMAKDGYSWWSRRLHQMAEYFHAYRIDHILGFFRIWEIPETSCTAALGRFRPSHPLSRQELESKGIWDFNRLCDPHVTWRYLLEIFEDLATEVSTRFFTEDEGLQRFYFREAYNSEVKIRQWQARHNSPYSQSETDFIKSGLMKCIQNVVLIRNSADPDAFYPRFDLMSTESFEGLESHWKKELHRLHDDYFYHRQNEMWREHAMKTLPALIHSSDMLICGEDLGMIPACVHPVMNELGLIGMRVQRIPTEGEFGDPMSYPYLTVCCAACHDVSTIRAWWEEDEERTQRFYKQMLHKEGRAPLTCTPEIVEGIIQHHFQSPSVLATLQIQDLFALSEKYNQRPPHEESINDPTNPRHYWRYRMHETIETLLEDTALAEMIQKLLKRGSRGRENWMGRRCWMPSNGSKRVLNG